MKKPMLHHCKFKKSFLVFCLVLLATLSLSNPPAPAQDLPDKIRGYKVYKAEISVTNESPETSDFGAALDFEEPKIESVSLLGIRLSLASRVTINGQSGAVDFISFKDFVVNGIPVEIDEYENGFDFKKGEAVKLEKPIEIFVGLPQALRGAVSEAADSKDEWRVTGRVFVFGKFKKFGFKFKRVVPVEVDLLIKNPLKTEKD